MQRIRFVTDFKYKWRFADVSDVLVTSFYRCNHPIKNILGHNATDRPWKWTGESFKTSLTTYPTTRPRIQDWSISYPSSGTWSPFILVFIWNQWTRCVGRMPACFRLHHYVRSVATGLLGMDRILQRSVRIRKKQGGGGGGTVSFLETLLNEWCVAY